jgi:uncharacterized membrane protein YfcA
MIPKFPTVKEWAYAGFTFAWISAIVAHYLVREIPSALLALALLILLFLSYFTRPASRRWRLKMPSPQAARADGIQGACS